jgi:hypothetical protein
VSYSHNLASHLDSSIHGHIFFFKLPVMYAASALKLYLFLGLLVRCAFLVYNCHSRTKRSVNREPMRVDLNLKSNGGSWAHNHKDQVNQWPWFKNWDTVCDINQIIKNQWLGSNAPHVVNAVPQHRYYKYAHVLMNYKVRLYKKFVTCQSTILFWKVILKYSFITVLIYLCIEWK